MDIAALPNPYDYRNPVRDASLFAGRDDELAKLRYEFGQAAPDRPSIYIAIHGRRAAGKTSLLRRTLERLHDRLRIGIVEGDIETSIDADRLSGFGAKAKRHLPFKLRKRRDCHLPPASASSTVS